jgi:hypothetical protein
MSTTRKLTRSSKRPRSRPTAWTVLRSTDRVRWSRVQAAQARIASGFYDRDEVQAAVVAAVLRELRRH